MKKDPSKDETLRAELEGARPEGDALAMEQARARLEQRLFGESARPARLGRFVLIERLGEGGMGVVWSAYDPKLDRRVALKLLRSAEAQSPGPSSAHQRLVREAQALARLSHPNVVPVHDVDTVDGQVVVVMEFVSGKTLDVWAEESRRSWRAVLGVYLQAGRGLEAAHRVGVVHRDFKPQNAMIGDDGRVRVVDFGLALSQARPAVVEHVQEEPLVPAAAGEVNATTVGGPAGTPAYMAPEQLRAEPADARTDQFGFCVALYEALYGERPFAGATLAELARNASNGDVREAPRDAAVPTWLRSVLLRGLSPDPEERFPSMRELLAALGRDPARARRRALAAAAGLAVLGVAAFSIWWRAGAPARLCRSMEDRLAGAWDDATRTRIRASFGATNRPYALDTYDRVSRTLDGYAQQWVGMRTEACEATVVHGDQSERVMDLRMRCLDRRLGELQALTTLFAERADAAMVDEAVEASSSLTRLDGCADVEALEAVIPPPESPEIRARVGELSERLDEAGALEKTALYGEALEIATAVAGETEGLDYPPLHAEAVHQRASLLMRLGRNEVAEPLLHEAGRLASRAGDDRRVVQILTDLLWAIGAQARYDEMTALRPLVEMATARLSDDRVARGETLYILGRYLEEQGKHAEARAYAERALALAEDALGPDHVHVADTLNLLASASNGLGEPERARAYAERALEIKVEAVGPEHPTVAYVLNNLGVTAHAAGDLDAALAYVERSLAIWEGALGAEHPSSAMARNNVGYLLYERGEYDEALHEVERSLAIKEKLYGADHLTVAVSLTSLGEIQIARDRADLAVGALERALGIREAAGAGPALMAEAEFALARALWDSGGDRRRAKRLAERARDAYAAAGEGRKEELAEVEEWLEDRG